MRAKSYFAIKINLSGCFVIKLILMSDLGDSAGGCLIVTFVTYDEGFDRRRMEKMKEKRGVHRPHSLASRGG